jgi:hypothetical protein
MRKAFHHIHDLVDRVSRFKVSINQFYINYIQLYDRFASINLYVRDILPTATIPLPSFFNITGIPLGEMLLPTPFDVPDINIDIMGDVIVADITSKIC